MKQTQISNTKTKLNILTYTIIMIYNKLIKEKQNDDETIIRIKRKTTIFADEHAHTYIFYSSNSAVAISFIPNEYSYIFNGQNWQRNARIVNCLEYFSYFSFSHTGWMKVISEYIVQYSYDWEWIELNEWTKIRKNKTKREKEKENRKKYSHIRMCTYFSFDSMLRRRDRGSSSNNSC